MAGLRIASLAVASLCGLGIAGATAQQLPEGAGKALVEGICTGCHQTNMISLSSGYSHKNWDELVGTMIDLSPSPETRDEILKYLAANFPEGKNPRPAKQVSGAFPQPQFKEWTTPTLGQRTRDPVEAPDGSIWWVGQFGNVMGRLNPKTGEMKEYQLPAKALPHSVSIDKDGTPWYTGNGNGTVGKLDSKTGEIKVYQMPDAAARDPHTAEFDRKGRLWFTLQQSNMLGRLDPVTGEVKVVKTGSAGKPYGIKIDANDTPWFACNGSNCLVKIDPDTMELTEVKLPIATTTVRRLDIAEDGIIWYVNSTMGKLGRYDPKSGAIKEWDSPSGPKSHPYAIAVVDGIVWYNESGVRPDMLVRFDPKTETFQSWPIPSGGVQAGIVRHMRTTRDGGDLLIHQSSTNKIIFVPIRSAVPTR